MRVIFAGTPGFAVPALRALVHAGHDVCLVLTQPDRAAGRGLVAQPSAVKRAALELGLAVFQPIALKDPIDQAQLANLRADVMVVVAYGLILPPAVLDIARYGALNIHASLLPRWRGAAPIQRAVEAGDLQTGVGIMQMEAGLDTGPVLLEVSTPISGNDTAASLHDQLSAIGAQAIVQVLGDLPHYRARARAQSPTGMSYAAKISKDQAQLDWRRDAATLARQVRAFNPAPGAMSRAAGVPIKIAAAEAVVGAHIHLPGQVLTSNKDTIIVACGIDALRLLSVQRAGGKRLTVAEFQRGAPLEVGAHFDLPPFSNVSV